MLRSRYLTLDPKIENLDLTCNMVAQYGCMGVVVYIIASLHHYVIMHKKEILMSVRTTITIEEDMLKLLKYKAVEVSSSVSKLINELLHESFREDSQDLKAFDERKNEENIGFETFLKQLESDGKL